MTVVDPRRERELQRQRALLNDPVRREAMAKEMTAGDEQQILEQAAELVILSANGSWKMLNRKLRLGQGHAQRVLDILEMHGVVGKEVAGQRRVLVEPADLDATIDRLRATTPTRKVAKSGGAEPDPATPPPPPVDDRVADVAEEGGVDLVKGGEPPATTPGGEGGEPGGGEGGGHPETAGHHPWQQDDIEGGFEGGDPPTTSLAKRPTTAMAEPPPATPATLDNEGGEQGGERPRPLLVGRIIRGGSQVATTIREGDSRTLRATRRAGYATRGTARYSWVAGQGIWFWLKRAGTASNFGHAREQLRMARIAGLPDEIERWGVHLEKLRNQRIKRLKDLPHAVKGVAITLGVAALAVAVFLLLVGVLAGIVASGVSSWGWTRWGFADGWHAWWWALGWFSLLISAIIVVAAFLSLTLSIPVAVAKAHEEGRKRAKPPRFLLSLDERASEDSEITPSRVAIALRDCGIPALKLYIKESAEQGAELLGPITPDGKGMGVLIRLISSVSTDDVVKRRKRIAEACDRHEYELLITIPKAHHVYLWFAEPGVLDKPIGPSPLVTATTPIKASIEKGRAPWGETLKGDPVGVWLWQQHLLITGLSNQGKTRCLRALALWAAFDPNVHFWVANLKGVDADWDMFRDLCDPGRFVKGPSDQDACAATHMVEDAEREMIRRLESGRTDWPTLICNVDEAQRAYTNPLKDEDDVPYGGQANNSRYCRSVRNIKNQGRAVNVLMWEGTQDPTNQNLPKLTREASHIRIALVVGSPEQAKMALGAAAVDGIGGGAPHLLRKDQDAGMVVMHGGKVPIPLGEKALTVRTHHIDDREAWIVAGRALAKRRSRSTPMVIDAAPEKIDHLANIHQAMNSEDVVRTVVVLGRLMKDWPDLYADGLWDSQDTSRVINAYKAAGHDIDIRKRMSGQSCLVLEEVETVLRERDEVLP